MAWPRLRAGTLLLSTVVVALLGMVAYAVQREMVAGVASAGVPVVASAGGRDEPQRALSAEEEAYAVALWPLHSETSFTRLEVSGLMRFSKS